VKTYLGRPWRPYAAVVFINTEMSEVVRPVGWNNWNAPEREKSVRYAEFNNSGPGASPQERVSWIRRLKKAEAAKLTAKKVLSGTDEWEPK
jgi:pectinesterase